MRAVFIVGVFDFVGESLAVVQVGVDAIERDELRMGSALDDAPFAHDDNFVGDRDGRNAVGDKYGRSHLPFGFEPAENDFLGLGIDAGQTVVEQKDSRVSNQGAGNRRALFLSAGQVDAAFAEEGVAMGYTLRRLLRYDAREFEATVVGPRPEFRYLHYVGLGFWSGMRNHSAARLARIVEGLDPLHGYLCYDGYGFKHAFFEYRKNPDVLRQLDALQGYARNAAYQGVGRAFYFLFMSDPETLIRHIRQAGDNAEDVAAGLGLAATFVNPDRLGRARFMGESLPAAWRPHFHLGMCFALKARSIADRGFLDRCVCQEDAGVREAVWASIRECDRVELLVRSRLDELGEDGYPQWRRQVTDWLGEHIEYPMRGVSTPIAAGTGETGLPGDDLHVDIGAI